MTRRRISQREARQWKRRALDAEETLSRQANAWAEDWPGGVHLGDTTFVAEAHLPSQILTARKLGHAVVVTADGQRVRFYAKAAGSVRR